MNCTDCKTKSCRQGSACKAYSADENIAGRYFTDENRPIVQIAAQLTDNGRAGTLSRIEEIVEFCKTAQYKKIGIAYCFGIEEIARKTAIILRNSGLKVISVSCSAGGLTQKQMNARSNIEKVGCNPIGQAEILNNEKTELVIIMGICVGHDILLHRHLKCDTTTLLVKDRLYNNNPIEGILKFEI